MYEDIINMEYPNAEIENFFSDDVLRAAQFAPFSALTGYDDVISETARIVEKKIELDESAKEEIDRKLIYLKENMTFQKVAVTHYVADKTKEGGKYVVKTGKIKRISNEEKKIVFDDKTEILIKNILKMESPVFKNFEVTE